MGCPSDLTKHELAVTRFLDCEQLLCGDHLGKGSGHIKSVKQYLLSTITDDYCSEVTRVETDYLEETGTITVSWGGSERGHGCVTHYDVKVKAV